jgi:hypothetical protein
VIASIGFASAPPGDRKMALITLAKDRKRKVKEDGKDRVITSYTEQLKIRFCRYRI